MRKKTKKEVSILMVVLAIISFVVMPAYAQPEYCDTAPEPCPNCPKARLDNTLEPYIGYAYPLWHIPSNCSTLGQGATASTLNAFDWDATYGYCEQADASGNIMGPWSVPAYAGTQNIQTVNNKLIVNICCCEDACEFAEGWVVGIELEIITQGVIWAGDNNITSYTALNPGVAGANPTATTCNQGEYQLTFSRWAKGTGASLHSTPCAQATQPNPLTAANADTFKVSYYNASRQWVNGPGITTNATIIRTPTPYDGYQIDRDDVQQNLCDFWIDVPAMMLTANAPNNAKVQIEAKLLVSPPYQATFTDGGVDPLCNDVSALGNLSYLRPDNDPGINSAANITSGTFGPPLCQTANMPTDIPNGIATGWTECDGQAGLSLNDCGCAWTWPSSFCPECESPCSCIKDIGIICCDTAELSNCIYFPYVITGVIDDDGLGWSTGIGVTKICGDSGSLAYTLTDCEGSVFTRAVGNFSNCDVFMMDDAEWVGDGEPAPGAAWLKVQATGVQIDGYEFLKQVTSTGMFGAATMPRLNCPCP